jgi:branched-subunit amino acid ABC-type transport system permease component
LIKVGSVWWMVPQALLTWLAWNQTNRGSTWGVIGIALFGVAEFIGALGEPITYELLNPATFNLLLAVIQAGMIIIPLVMMVFGIQEWRRRRSETRQKETPPSRPARPDFQLDAPLGDGYVDWHSDQLFANPAPSSLAF